MTFPFVTKNTITCWTVIKPFSTFTTYAACCKCIQLSILDISWMYACAATVLTVNVCDYTPRVNLTVRKDSTLDKPSFVFIF